MEKLDSNLLIYLGVTIFLSALIIYFQPIIGILCLILSAGMGIILFKRDSSLNDEVLNGIDKLYQQFDDLNRTKMNQLPVGYVIVDDDGTIVWYNDAFYKAFYQKNGNERSIKGRNIEQELNLSLEDVLKNDDLEFTYRKIVYEIVTQQISDSRGDLHIINFFDVTLLKRQKEIYSRYEPIFCYISVDNYDEIIDNLPSYQRSAVQSQIDLHLTDWANRKDAFILRIEADKYLVIFEREKLQVILDAHFRILDEIREIRTEDNNTLSLSIGVGLSNKPLTIKESDEISHTALEMAQARGGDQAVVKIDDDIEYYGGKTEAKEKSNKVKARIKAQALKELMKEADNILIMGHRSPDLDCLGAGMGLIDAAKDMNKSAKFILTGINYSIKELCKYLKKQEGYKDVFVTPHEAEEMVRDNTLLIIVDTQNSDYVDYRPIIDMVEKKVVIDHHRRPENVIENVTLAYSEPYASSTCEIITELLSYFDSKSVLKPVGASVLIAGIYMDTKMFVKKTGVRTFEAASFLKRKGADMEQARRLLQDDFQTYTNRMKAVQSALIYFDSIAISIYEDQSEYAKIIASQAADEMLNIKGIKASFVVLKSNEGINISGRSNGEINVQLILEALGGGGHMTMAGAQITTTDDLNEVKEMLLEQVGLYIEDERKNELEDNIA